VEPGAPIVVVRDAGPELLQHPPRRMFGERRMVRYVQAHLAGHLPAAPHYVFNLSRFDDVSRIRAARAHQSGAAVTFILRHVDEGSALELHAGGWNVVPAYGDTEHLGTGTLRRALGMACEGRRVVASGFLANSAGPLVRHPQPEAPFIRLVREMSEEARSGEQVVAAVLAPQRTGSKWLRDLLGWTTGSQVQIVHEHDVPGMTGDWPDSRPLFEALALESDPGRRAAMRRTALRTLLLSASRRYIFVTDRDPVERLTSYFVKRHSRWLRAQLDDSGWRFRDVREIQCAFEAWLPAVVAQHARWFRSTLSEPFGLNVCRARPAGHGLLVAHHARNTLVVVPIERLNALRAAVEAEYGADSCAPLADNSAAARGDAALLAAFRRHVYVPRAIDRSLRAIPEVAYLRAAVDATPRVSVAE